MEKYYVYVYLDQRKIGIWKFKEFEFKFQPFYIGKGCGKRMQMHLKQCLLNKRNIKNSIIKSIQKDLDELPIHYKLYENLSEEKAFQIEKEFVEQFGKLEDKSGILANIADGGNLEWYRSNKKEQFKLVYQFDLNGKFIKEWLNVHDAESSLKYGICSIRNAIERKGISHGYFWAYSNPLPWPAKDQSQKYFNIKAIDPISNKIIHSFSSIKEAIKELNMAKSSYIKLAQCFNTSKTYYKFRWTADLSDKLRNYCK